MMTSLYKTLLDIIFPQKELERKISTLSKDVLSEKLHIQERSGIVSLFEYKDPLIKKMIWLLKYKGNAYVAELFADSISEYLTEELSDDILFSKVVVCVIVPLPLSKKRERERGFNQMKLITDTLQKTGDFSVDSQMLIRIKHTVPQTTLARKEDRAKNVKDVFGVRGNIDLTNTHVILIDDVYTTGSTLQEAQKTLTKAGAHKVSCITLAH